MKIKYFKLYEIFNALSDLGIKIQTTNKSYEVSAKKLKKANIVMYETGETACENTLFASALIPGSTTISFMSNN